MLERLLPNFVACAETRRDEPDIELFPAELRSLGRAVDKRRREFTTGRACARRALGRLGVPVVAIPSGPRGEPVWPVGVVGSITHCRGYRACAVASSAVVAALGIDAEPNAPLPDGVAEEVVRGRELELLGVCHPSAPDGEPVDLPRLLFSAKEAVFKAWFPLTGAWLGYEDVELSVDRDGAGFRARLLVPGPVVDGARLDAFVGRWTLEQGVIGTAVVVPPGARPSAARG